MKNNPRAKEANTRVIQLDFNLPLYQPSLPSYFTQPPFFLEFVLYRSIKRSSGYFTFFFLFFFLPVASLATREGKKKKPRPSRGRSEGVARISVVYERAIKEKEREGKGYGCARNGQPGIYTNSTRGIRRRGEGGGMETIPRNFIGQPISGIIGNRWKSSFRRLCLLLASLD